MQRRTFMKAGGVGLAVAASTPAMLLLEGCPTVDQWVQAAENDIPVIVEIITSITGVVGEATGNGTMTTAVAAIVSQSVATLRAGLDAFKNAVDSYKAAKTQGNLQAVIAALTSVQKDVTSVLGTLPISIPGIGSIIVAAVGTAITVLSSLQAIIPGAAPAPAQLGVAAQAVKQKVNVPNAGTLRVGFNTVLLAHGYGHFQLQ